MTGGTGSCSTACSCPWSLRGDSPGPWRDSTALAGTGDAADAWRRTARRAHGTEGSKTRYVVSRRAQDEATKCPCGWARLETGQCGDHPMCEAVSVHGDGLLEIKACVGFDCPYRMPFGNVQREQGDGPHCGVVPVSNNLDTCWSPVPSVSGSLSGSGSTSLRPGSVRCRYRLRSIVGSPVADTTTTAVAPVRGIAGDEPDPQPSCPCCGPTGDQGRAPLVDASQASARRRPISSFADLLKCRPS